MNLRRLLFTALAIFAPAAAGAIDTPKVTITGTSPGVTISDTRAGHTAALRNISLTDTLAGGSLISTSAGGVISGTSLKGQNISGTTGTFNTLTVANLIATLPSLPKAFGATTDIGGTLGAGSYNVASISNVSGGVYDIAFTTPMTTTSYAVVSNPSEVTPACNETSIIGAKTVNGFRIYLPYICGSGTQYGNRMFNFAVFENH